MLSHKSISILFALSITVASFASEGETVAERQIKFKEQIIDNIQNQIQANLSEVSFLNSLIKINIAKHDYYHQIAMCGYGACHKKDNQTFPALPDDKISIIEERARACAKIAGRSLRKFPSDIKRLRREIAFKEADVKQAKKELQELKIAAFAEQPGTIIDILEGAALKAWLQT